jgi:hypothetical protein
VDEERAVENDEETEGCPSVDEGRGGIPVISVTSSKQRQYIGRGYFAAIFFGYLSGIDEGIRVPGEFGGNCSRETKDFLPGK